MENFQDMADQFLAGHAAVQVASAQSLGKAWAQLIENALLRERMGNAAREIAERNRGATNRTLDRISPLLHRTTKGNPS
jgi:3-deoxy-D-manno-octulosonic-acid transferase